MRFLKAKANRAVRKTADLVARASRGKLVNINSTSNGVSSILSNFTKSPFVLDGIKWDSFEGFWQGIKFQENDARRQQAQNLSGVPAKKISAGVSTNFMHYSGKQLSFGSKELYELAKRAQRARFQQNPEQLQALISTGNAKLIHLVALEDSKSLPRKVFCKILTELRKEFKESGKKN